MPFGFLMEMEEGTFYAAASEPPVSVRGTNEGDILPAGPAFVRVSIRRSIGGLFKIP